MRDKLTLLLVLVVLFVAACSSTSTKSTAPTETPTTDEPESENVSVAVDDENNGAIREPGDEAYGHVCERDANPDANDGGSFYDFPSLLDQERHWYVITSLDSVRPGQRTSFGPSYSDFPVIPILVSEAEPFGPAPSIVDPSLRADPGMAEAIFENLSDGIPVYFGIDTEDSYLDLAFSSSRQETAAAELLVPCSTLGAYTTHLHSFAEDPATNPAGLTEVEVLRHLLGFDDDPQVQMRDFLEFVPG